MRKILFICAFATLLLLSSPIYGEDAADGEVREEGEDAAKEEIVDSVKGEASSADVATNILFTSPHSNDKKELVAGQLVKFLIGFANRGEKDFIVKASDTSFRYPGDYSYHIQNFTLAKYDQLVQPKQEATFDYAFIPSEQFIGRPLGLVINLHYVDQDGTFFTTTVFNETVQIVEDEMAFSTETGFLYLTFAAIVVVLFFIGQHYLSKFTRKTHSASHYVPSQEIGTGKHEVDFEWIPRTSLEREKKSPKMGSPRNRRAN